MVSRHAQKFLGLTLGTIALSTIVSACGSTVDSPPPPPGPPGSMEGMNHPGMAPGQPMKPGMTMPKMDLGPADKDYDLRFVDAMIPHHEGAIVMATDVLQKSQRPELQKLAKAMIGAQTKEIDQMQQWRKAWYPTAPSTPMAWHGEKKQMMAMKPDQISAMRMDRDLGKADIEYDLRFLTTMIPHHQAAIVMAKDLAQKTARSELQTMAKTIITTQQAEMEQMKELQNTWYPKPN
jgi:uncharacterized protein (DUF305 family)